MSDIGSLAIVGPPDAISFAWPESVFDMIGAVVSASAYRTWQGGTFDFHFPPDQQTNFASASGG